MTSPLRAIVADDEPLTRERVCALAADAGIAVVGEARNGLEALDLIARLSPDIAFLDVEMPELDGFGVLAALDEASGPVIVFITAYEHYAVKAFDVGAIDYLHKPVTRDRFLAAVSRASERVQQRTSADRHALIASALSVERTRGFRTRYVVRRGKAHYFVPVQDIDWIDAADNYLQLHTGTRMHLSRGTMKQAEDELDPARFIRVHRSAIVAVDHVQSVTSADSGGFVLVLSGGATVRASRHYGERIRALMRNQ